MAESAEAPKDDRKAAFSALVARRRAALQHERQERLASEDASTENWSGLRISNRCLGREKLDAAMRGKDLVKLDHLGSLSASGRNQVVIGVLTTKSAKVSVKGETYAEWTLTDLERSVTLVLRDRAVEFWVDPTGPSTSKAVAGSILAVLNPQATGRSNAMMVTFESQVIKLGTCPALGYCAALGAEGLPCREPINAEAGGHLCAKHAAMSHGERQAGLEPHPWLQTRKQVRPAPTPARAGSQTRLSVKKARHGF